MKKNPLTIPTENQQLWPESATEMIRARSQSWQIFKLVGDVFQLVLIGYVLDTLLFTGMHVSLTVQILAISVLLACAIRWSGWVFLIANQIRLFFLEPGDSQMLPDVGAFLYCFAALMLVGFFCRARAIRGRFSDWFATQATLIFDPNNTHQRPVIATPQDSPTAKNPDVDRVFSPLQWMVFLGVVLLGMLLMLWLPITSMLYLQWLERAANSEYVLWPGAYLVTLIVGLLVLARELAWRQMSVAQASLYLRGSFVLEHFQDLKMIVLRQLKIKRKSAQP